MAKAKEGTLLEVLRNDDGPLVRIYGDCQRAWGVICNPQVGNCYKWGWVGNCSPLRGKMEKLGW